LNWKDILKAEIQVIPSATTADGDVNVDLEDDDCIRWVKKLVELFGELPSLDADYASVSKEYFREDLLTEESACKFKKLVNMGKIGYKEYKEFHNLGLIGSHDLITQNVLVNFGLAFKDNEGGTNFSSQEGKQTNQESGPIMELNLLFILTSPSGSVVSIERTGDLMLSSEQIGNFERQIKKICRHCSWQPTGLNKFFTNFRSNYNNESVEKTTGAVTTSSPSAVSGKLFNISYGGKKRGKKRQSKKEDY